MSINLSGFKLQLLDRKLLQSHAKFDGRNISDKFSFYPEMAVNKLKKMIFVSDYPVGYLPYFIEYNAHKSIVHT